VKDGGNTGNAFGKKNWWIWPAIIVMIAALSILTYKLTGEMKREKV